MLTKNICLSPAAMLSGLLGLTLVATGCSDDGVSPADAGSSGAETSPTSGELTGGSDGTGGETAGETDDPETTGSGGEPEPGEGYLPPADHLVRVSMALRGQRPSVEELAAVSDDPDLLPEFVDQYMQGEGFGEIVRDLHNDSLLVGIERALPKYAPLQDELGLAINESVQQTPLRLIERVVTQDLPYSEIVTADYWMVDSRGAAVYGLDYDSGGDEWQQVDIPGERPPAGILSDNALFLRHESAGANYHRGRANAITRALLCQDFLDTDIVVGAEVDLSDPDAVVDAVNTNPACLACHSFLDPLASHLFVYPGAIQPSDLLEYPVPFDYYQPQLVDRWQTTTQTAPGYYGEASAGLDGLGQSIAADYRFPECAAKRFYAYFQQVDVEDVDGAAVESFTEAFVDSGLNARTLIRSIMLSDEFRRSEGLDPEEAVSVVGYKRARPVQLALLIESITGFEWEITPELEVADIGAGTLSSPRNGSVGFEVLAGGIDSLAITQASRTVNATTSLFLRDLAAEAASYAVERDFAAGEATLLHLVDGDEREEAKIRAQLVELFAVIYGEIVEPDSVDVDDAYALFSAVLSGSDTSHAWKATLTAMLQDVNVIYY